MEAGIERIMNSLSPYCELAAALGRRYPQIQLIYLFGSQVRGDAGPLSDIDLATFIDDGIERGKPTIRLRSEIEHEIAIALETDRIDLVLLNEAPVELAFHAVADGIRLYERSVADRVEYEAYVMSRYGDYLPTLRKQRDEILHGDEAFQKRVHRHREAIGRTKRTLGTLGGDSK